MRDALLENNKMEQIYDKVFTDEMYENKRVVRLFLFFFWEWESSISTVCLEEIPVPMAIKYYSAPFNSTGHIQHQSRRRCCNLLLLPSSLL